MYTEQLNSLKDMAGFLLHMKVSLSICLRMFAITEFLSILDQVYFYLFDALPLLLAIIVYVPFWPGKYVEEKVVQMDSIRLQSRDRV